MSKAIDSYFPFGDTLLCTTEKMPEKTSGGIIMPEKVRDKHQLTQGVVLKVGNGEEVIHCWDGIFTKGRVVIFGMHTESIIALDGVEYAIVPLSGVLAYGPILPEEQDLVNKADK